MDSSKLPILLLGRTKTGKTSFKGQLYLRLINSDQTSINLAIDPEKRTAIEEAVRPLEDGNSVKRTASDINEETVLSLKFKDGRIVDIPWHDYAGEKVNEIVETRVVSEDWNTRVNASKHWMLFIHVGGLKKIDNPYTRPRKELKEPDNKEINGNNWCDTTFFIELVQILIYIKGLGMRKQIETPVLQVVLSRCDEIGLDEGGNPREELRKRLPLFVEFLETNWHPSKLSFIGLSPQEKELTETSEDDDFIFDGPDQFGYVILPDGTKSKDLTLAISNLVNMTDEDKN